MQPRRRDKQESIQTNGIECLSVLPKCVHFKDAKWVQLRLEDFNAPNHAQFYWAASVNGNISSTPFGRIVTAGSPLLV